MKASELVEKLNALIAEHGDHEVVEAFSGYGTIVGAVSFDYDEKYVDIPAVFAIWEQ